jgi:uncharacterized protein YllA (UPF0747 family)
LQRLKALYEEVSLLASKADPTLKPWVLAEGIRQQKKMKHIGTRIFRAEKKNLSVQMDRIDKLFERLYPGGKMQERRENYLYYAAQIGDKYLETLFEYLDPFNKELVVIIED